MSTAISDSIRAKVASKRAEIALLKAQSDSISRKIDVIEGEVRAYEDAIRLMAMSMDDIHPPSDVLPPRKERGHSVSSGGRDIDKRRGPRGVWRLIMPELLKFYGSQVFTLQEVSEVCELIDASVNRATIRSQMSNYVSGGYLERVKEGRFKFTLKGHSSFGELLNALSEKHSGTEPASSGDAQDEPAEPPGDRGPPAASVRLVSVGGASPR